MKIGFIDYYLDEWHSNNYPELIAKASGGDLPPFPLRSKGNFPSKLSGNCQPGFRLNFPQAHFSALDIRKGGASIPVAAAHAANRDTPRQHLIPP